jgi:arylsulfatase A-like enzyme
MLTWWAATVEPRFVPGFARITMRRVTSPSDQGSLPSSCLELAAAALLALAACSPPAIENVVLISIDTLRPDRLGIHGAERELTPVLDELGRRGVVFEQAIAQAPWTIPSHASMLTSQYPSVLGVGPYANPGKLSAAALTLAELFREHGYATAAITGGYVSRELGFDQGFDSFRETPDTPSMAYTVTYADEWLARRDPARPFFLFLHTFEVHQYRPPAEFRNRWVRPYEGELAALDDVPRFAQSPANQERVRTLGAEDWRYLRDLYDACVASVDSEIGRLMRVLEERGLSETTLVVVTSDHGEEFGEHGGSGHGYTLHDENLRVPLLMSHPSLPALRVAEQVRLLDLAPTLAELTRLPIPPLWQGTSLVPLLGGASLALPAFAEHAHRPMKSVREPGAKLVVEARGPRRLLFDLAADPAERTNLVGTEPEHEPRLCAALRRFIETNAAHERLVAVPDSTSPSLRDTLELLGYAGTESEPDADRHEWLDLLRCE